VNRQELEHVINAAAEITGDEIVVIGSQAILGPFPQAPPALLRSMEADLYPRNDPDRAIEIDGALGDDRSSTRLGGTTHTVSVPKRPGHRLAGRAGCSSSRFRRCWRAGNR
jgi:hypothetical protein